MMLMIIPILAIWSVNVTLLTLRILVTWLEASLTVTLAVSALSAWHSSKKSLSQSWRNRLHREACIGKASVWRHVYLE